MAEDGYLLQLVRYIHKNPVRVGNMRNAEQYAWSSHRAYLSKAKKWEWLHKQFILSMLAENSKRRLQLYRSYMAEDEDKTFLDQMSLKLFKAILHIAQIATGMKIFGLIGQYKHEFDY